MILGDDVVVSIVTVIVVLALFRRSGVKTSNARSLLTRTICLLALENTLVMTSCIYVP